MSLLFRLVQARNIIPLFKSKPINCKLYEIRHNIRSKSSISEVNTNVIKDVILFKNDNPKYFKIVNLFAIAQLVFWSYLSLTSYETLRDVKPNENSSSWWERINLGEKKYRLAITISSFMIGYSIFFGAWIYILRSVRYVVLNKGGQKCTLVTYTPFGQNRMLTADLKYFSAKTTREQSSSFLPIKVKGYFFHHILDMKGEFRNPALFDATIGLKRSLSK